MAQGADSWIKYAVIIAPLIVGGYTTYATQDRFTAAEGTAHTEQIQALKHRIERLEKRPIPPAYFQRQVDKLEARVDRMEKRGN